VIRQRDVACEKLNLVTLLSTKQAYSRLLDIGEDAKVKGRRKVGGAGKRKKPLLSPVSSRFIFLFALFQFTGPD